MAPHMWLRDVTIKASQRRGATAQWSVEWRHINGEKSSNSWQTGSRSIFESIWGEEQRERETEGLDGGWWGGRGGEKEKEGEWDLVTKPPRSLLSEIRLQDDKGPYDELLFRLISPGLGSCRLWGLSWKTPQNGAYGTFSEFQRLFVEGNRERGDWAQWEEDWSKVSDI